MSQNHENRAHSHIGASSMDRWSTCPGSVRLSAGIPSKSSVYAEEGTRAHELAEKSLRVFLSGYSADASAAYVRMLQDREKYPPEMEEAVTVYTSTVEDDVSKDKDAKVLVEHRFDLSSIHPGLFGTADCVAFFPGESLLRVYDYKHGAGIPVAVVENVQLMYYGLGALLTAGFSAREIELVIVQPRCNHPGGSVRRWRIDAVALSDFAVELEQFARATEAPDAPLLSGEHCRFCPAKLVCPKIEEQRAKTALEEFTFKPDAPAVKPVNLSEALRMIPSLEAWIKGVDELAYAEAMAGRAPPGFKLVAKRASRKWAAVDEASGFFKGYDVSGKREFFHAPELKSPAQVEKLLGKDEKEVLAAHVVSVSSGYALVEESDPRPGVVPKPDAAIEFVDPLA